MSKEDTVASLKRDMESAYLYSATVESLLVAVREVNSRLTKVPAEHIVPGTVGFFATISILQKYGITYGQGVTRQADPAYSRDKFMSECGQIYDLLDLYYETETATKESNNEDDRRSSRT